jgi:hypothetical protein
MQDAHFGHRDWVTGEVIGDSSVKTDWDYALMAAYQIIQDNTLPSGILAWDNDADNVIIEAVRKTDKFEAAKQAITSGKNYKGKKGEVWVPRNKLQWGEYPTYSGWVKEQIAAQDKLVQ